MTKPATTSRAVERNRPSPRSLAAHPERAAEPERAFLRGPRSADAAVEEMGEDAVRAMTSGEDETRAQLGDAAMPSAQFADLEEIELDDIDLEEIVSGEYPRPSPPSRP